MNIYFEALNVYAQNGAGAGDKNAIQKFMGKNDHKVWGRFTMVFVHHYHWTNIHHQQL